MKRLSLSMDGPLRETRFVERPNRFLVRCRLGGRGRDAGRVATAHLADPGRLRELLVPGRRMWLRPVPYDVPRKTRWSAVLVESPDGERLVSVDTTLPNRLIGAALRAGVIEELREWRFVRAEVPVGNGRLDFLLRRDGGRGKTRARQLALEVKSVTLVEGGVGKFPDAVTARGARHLRELAKLAGEGDWSAAVLFVVQRSDARRVRAAPEIDAEFAAALAEARDAGVTVLARRCRVGLDRVTLGAAIPVE